MADPVRVHITSSHRTKPRSPLSELPIVIVDDKATLAALPTRWADDMQPLMRDIDGSPAVCYWEPYLAAVEKRLEEIGGIKAVVIKDTDYAEEQAQIRKKNDQITEFFRRMFGTDGPPPGWNDGGRP